MSFNKENTKERIRRLKVRGEQPIPADTDVLYVHTASYTCLISSLFITAELSSWRLKSICTIVHAPGVILVRLQMKANVQCHCPMSMLCMNAEKKDKDRREGKGHR